MRNWYKNEWIIAIGSGTILLVIPSIWDIITGKEFANTLTWLFSLNVKLGWVFLTIFVSVLLLLFLKFLFKTKVIYEPLFIEGVQVIMKTNVKPIMVTGEFDRRTNEIWCTWTINSEIKKEKINQNLLKLYEPVDTLPILGGRPTNFWRY